MPTANFNLGGRGSDFVFEKPKVTKRRSKVTIGFGNSAVTINRSAAADLCEKLNELLADDE